MILWQSRTDAAIAARIAVIGDFLPAWKYAHERPQLGSASSWGKMAERLASHFGDVDASFVNLECTLNASGLQARPLNGLGDIVSAPDDCLEYLTAIRARAVGIANNHAYDFGDHGVDSTCSAIATRGFIPLGAGRNLEAPPEVFVWRGAENIGAGFWAAARATADAATRARAGVEPATVDRARRALQEMKSQGARFSVALLHAGCLRTNYPSPEDLRLIDALAHAGFDLVAASHSHRISGAKLILRPNHHPAFCFYGLGSIVSGFVASPAEREGLVAVAGLNADGELAQIEVRPLLLDNHGFGAVPSGAAAHALLDGFQQLSAHIADGSYARRFHREISPGLVHLYMRDARRALQQGGLRGIARKAGRVRLRHVRRLIHSVLP